MNTIWSNKRTVVVGGGAAGFFVAVNLKEMLPQMDVTILERSSRLLAKVAISGGGRCNCTNTFDAVADLSAVYPRGHRLLKRLFNVFGPRDAYQWFERHGVPLVAEADGCVFPASQDARSVVDCFLAEARRHDIKIFSRASNVSLASLAAEYDFVVVCTGGGRSIIDAEWLRASGHEIVEPVPSLFSLSIADRAMNCLMGTVVDGVQTGIAGTKFRAGGPLLITHWGVSGPAVLRLSSYAARHLAECGYRAPLTVNWTGLPESEVACMLRQYGSEHPQRQVSSVCPCGLPRGVWGYLLQRTLGERSSVRWQALSRKESNRLTAVLTNDTYLTAGRAAFRDEFVTCGGIALTGLNPSTLESRHVKGLYFAGEVLDIDGVTGGFNFQAAWTTAYTVSRSIAAVAGARQDMLDDVLRRR